VFFGPQVPWDHVRQLASVYRACASKSGIAGASRCLIVGRDREDAARRARQYLEKTFAMYTRWSMQEDTMAPLALDFGRPLEEWSVIGSASDCVATLLEAQADIGLDGVGFTIYSLPESPSERIDYLHMINDDIVAPVMRASAISPKPVGESL
jgi:alkanesulfonate monooxygenase SsuD/methylene tetrahydromethanopterin reductase-like flavin-dependent oxidoreductase (luciferase family)